MFYILYICISSSAFLRWCEQDIGCFQLSWAFGHDDQAVVSISSERKKQKKTMVENAQRIIQARDALFLFITRSYDDFAIPLPAIVGTLAW